MIENSTLGRRVFLALVFILLVLPIAFSYYKYYYTKDYDYIVEANCDPFIEICFSRDCSLPDECPPNGLSNYKMFIVKGYDFNKCLDNSCEDECSNNLINCTTITCGDSDEDVCTTPENAN